MRLWQLDDVGCNANACQVHLLVSCQRHWARGVGWLPLIDWMSSIQKLSHDDATRSIWVILPKSVVVVAITWHPAEDCRAIRAGRFRGRSFRCVSIRIEKSDFYIF
jgi:hypothetical protein